MVQMPQTMLDRCLICVLYVWYHSAVDDVDLQQICRDPKGDGS